MRKFLKLILKKKKWLNKDKNTKTKNNYYFVYIYFFKNFYYNKWRKLFFGSFLIFFLIVWFYNYF